MNLTIYLDNRQKRDVVRRARPSSDVAGAHAAGGRHRVAPPPPQPFSSPTDLVCSNGMYHKCLLSSGDERAVQKLILGASRSTALPPLRRPRGPRSSTRRMYASRPIIPTPVSWNACTQCRRSTFVRRRAARGQGVARDERDARGSLPSVRASRSARAAALSKPWR